MSLSCDCDIDGEGWYFYLPNDYSVLLAKKSKRCVSCDKLIKPGDIVTSHSRFRPVSNEIEEKIYGDEIQLADQYHCESCADIEFSLIELGFCMNLGDSMKDCLEEYINDYGKK